MKERTEERSRCKREEGLGGVGLWRGKGEKREQSTKHEWKGGERLRGRGEIWK